MNVTKKFVVGCVNKALSSKVNELRLIALDEKKTITKTIPISEIISLTQIVAAGQFGHDGFGNYVVSSPIKSEETLRQTIQEQSKLWKGMIHVDGENVIFTVPVPIRQILFKKTIK